MNSSPLTAELPEFPPVDYDAAAVFLQEEAATYADVGEFYFRNPLDLGSQVLVNWLTDVAVSSSERRWGTLEMLALYGLTAAEVTGGLPLTNEEENAVVESVAADGPMRADLEHAAKDAIALLQSGSEPSHDLPEAWKIYMHVLPPVFTAACLVLAAMTLGTVKAVAAQEHAHPADLWQDWLSQSGQRNR